MKSVVSVSKQTREKTSSTRPEPHKNSYLTSSKTGMRGEPGDRGRVPHVDTAALNGADFSLYFRKEGYIEGQVPPSPDSWKGETHLSSLSLVPSSWPAGSPPRHLLWHLSKAGPAVFRLGPSSNSHTSVLMHSSLIKLSRAVFTMCARDLTIPSGKRHWSGGPLRKGLPYSNKRFFL